MREITSIRIKGGGEEASEEGVHQHCQASTSCREPHPPPYPLPREIDRPGAVVKLLACFASPDCADVFFEHAGGRRREGEERGGGCALSEAIHAADGRTDGRMAILERERERERQGEINTGQIIPTTSSRANRQLSRRFDAPLSPSFTSQPGCWFPMWPRNGICNRQTAQGGGGKERVQWVSTAGRAL